MNMYYLCKLQLSAFSDEFIVGLNVEEKGLY